VLTSKEILYLLELLGRREVIGESKEFPYSITVKQPGYHDGDRGKLQAKLSIMLEVAGKAGR
jgi:hypothetical protein